VVSRLEDGGAAAEAVGGVVWDVKAVVVFAVVPMPCERLV